MEPLRSRFPSVSGFMPQQLDQMYARNRSGMWDSPPRLRSRSPKPITRILKAETRLVPGEPFRGRVATIWGRSSAVLNRGAAGEAHYFSQLATGNLHDGPGLSQDDIPIWAEYNRLMTPARFVFQA